jgi:hypothetical protein
MSIRPAISLVKTAVLKPAPVMVPVRANQSGSPNGGNA